MPDHMKSQQKEKKPWESEGVKNATIIFGLFFLIANILVFFNPSAFMLYVSLLAGISFIITGILFLNVLAKYRNELMKQKKELVSYLIITLLSFIAGLGVVNQWVNGDTQYRIPNLNETFVIIYPLWILGSSILAGIIFIFMGIWLIWKNYKSSVSRLFFLSFMSFGIGWMLFATYNVVLNALHIQMIYLAFYCLIFSGLMLLAHACRLITTPNLPLYPRTFYLVVGISFITTILVSGTQLNHNFWLSPGEYGQWTLPTSWGKIREHSIVFGILSFISLFLPICYSIYNLNSTPEWITKERLTWVKRTRLGIIFFLPYIFGETISGLNFIEFLQKPVVPTTQAPLSQIILITSIGMILYSAYILLSGIPDVDKWFFDEIKFRAAPELREIDPEVNLAAIWKQIDDWQKESELTPKEMTTQKLEEYVQAAKSLLLKEEGKPATV